MMVNMSMNQLRRRYGNRASTCVEDGCVTMASFSVWYVRQAPTRQYGRWGVWIVVAYRGCDGWGGARFVGRGDVIARTKAGGVIERSMNAHILVVASIPGRHE